MLDVLNSPHEGHDESCDGYSDDNANCDEAFPSPACAAAAAAA